MPAVGMHVRALQLGDGLEIKGLEREDSFSANPLAFRTVSGGTATLFKSGAVVFFGMTSVEEEDLIRGLGPWIINPLKNWEIESTQIVVEAGDEELVGSIGALQLKSADPNRCCSSSKPWPSRLRLPMTNGGSPARLNASSRLPRA
jgi:hypothetical protein